MKGTLRIKRARFTVSAPSRENLSLSSVGARVVKHVYGLTDVFLQLEDFLLWLLRLRVITTCFLELSR